jgi:hypothetical protein
VPPGPAVTETVKLVGVARRVAQSVALRKSVLSVAPASPQPSKMLLLPGRAEPSSTGELSPMKNTRPLPYTDDPAITLVVLPTAVPVIHTSPRTVGLVPG